MKDAIMNFAAMFPKELAVVLLSLIPVAELRLAIPLAILNYGIHPIEAYFFACIGNLIPVPFIILFIRKIFNWMKQFKILHKLVVKLEEKANPNRKRLKSTNSGDYLYLLPFPFPELGRGQAHLLPHL